MKTIRFAPLILILFLLCAAVSAVSAQESSVPLVLVEGGTFTMGSPLSEEARTDMEAQHQVTVSSFLIGKYDVTAALYRDVMGIPGDSNAQANLPATRVNWFSAVEFCNRLSEREGLQKVYTIMVDTSKGTQDVTADWKANGYRLPTEAEWEYAARGGKKGVSQYHIYAGSDDPAAVAWFMENSGGVNAQHPVGLKAPNALGLYDITGLVEQWCWDLWQDYPTTPQTDPHGGTSGRARMVRGGSSDFSPADYNTMTDAKINLLRVASRRATLPDEGAHFQGFRVARTFVAASTVATTRAAGDSTKPAGSESASAWNKQFPSATFGAIAADQMGSVFVAGNLWSREMSDAGALHGWWIRKFNPDGTEDVTHWHKSFGVARDGQDNSGVSSIALDAWGNVYVVGYAGYVGHMGSRISWWIKKFDRTGLEDTTRWDKLINDGGDYTDDMATHAAVDGEGNLYVAGQAGSTGNAWWIRKFAPDGTEASKEWHMKPVGSAQGGIGDEEVTALVVDPREGVYVSGFGGLAAGGIDWWARKYSLAGKEDLTHWNKRITVGTGVNSRGFARTLVVDNSGNVYLAGSVTRDAGSGPLQVDWWIKKFDPKGQEILQGWDKQPAKNSGSAAEIRRLTIGPTDAVFAVEEEGLDPSGAPTPASVRKFTPDGQEEAVTWNRGTAESPNLAGLEEIVVSSDGSVYAAGTTGHDLFLKRLVDDQAIGFHSQNAVINDSKVRVRNEPLLTAAIVSQLEKGDSVTVLSRSATRVPVGSTSNYWYRVRTADGREGWTYGAFVTLGP